MKATTAILPLSLLISAPLALADDQPTQTTYKDWTRVCYAAPDSAKRCEAVQVISVTQNEQTQPILRATLSTTGADQGRFLEVALPLGMDLRAGIVMQIDEGEELVAAYTTCVPQGCAAVLPVNDSLFQAFQAGAGAKIGFRPFGTSQTQVIEMSLSGFTAASKDI